MALFFLFSLWGGRAEAGILLSWGQALSKGFVFTGRSEVVHTACLRWMENSGIQQLTRLHIRGELVSMEGDRNYVFACQKIVAKAKDIGESEVMVGINVMARARNYSFAGVTSFIVNQCMQDLSNDRVRILSRFRIQTLKSVSPYKLDSKEVSYRNSLRGGEICGAMAEAAVAIRDPFVQRYIAGFFLGRSFVFSGFKQIFMQSCKAYIRRNPVRNLRRYTIAGETYDLGAIVRDDLACEIFFREASVEQNSTTRYSVSGRVFQRNFVFIGTRQAMLNQCLEWRRRYKINNVKNLIINGQSYSFPRTLLGSSICYPIARAARKVDQNLSLNYSIGSIENSGFAFVVPGEELVGVCKNFMLENKIGFVRSVRLFGKRHYFSRPYRDELLCQKILELSPTVASEISEQRFRVAGRVRQERFLFFGGIRDIVSQCNNFFENAPALSTVSHWYSFVDQNPQGPELLRKDGNTYYGPEACAPIVAAADTEAGKQIFVGGQANGIGFSITGGRAISKLVCRVGLERAGIGTVNELRIFDRIVPIPGGSLPLTDICNLIVGQATEYDEIPNIGAISGTVADFPFRFSGRLDEVNTQCLEFIKEKDLNTVESLILNDEGIPAPLGVWQGDEICSVIIANRLSIL